MATTSNVTSAKGPEPPLSHLVVDALFGFLATVVMMLAVLVAIGAWAMDWPLIFGAAVALALLAHAGHRRGLVTPALSVPRAIAHSIIELAPLGGGIVAAVSIATGNTVWLIIGIGLIALSLTGKLLI